MQPLVWTTSLDDSERVTERSTHRQGTTNYELQTHWMWHSQWQTVSRSAGQEVHHLLWSPYVQKRVPRAGQWTLPAVRQISHNPLQYLLYIILINSPPPPVHTSIFRLTIFLNNFGWKLCMNFSHFPHTLHVSPVLTFPHHPNAH